MFKKLFKNSIEDVLQDLIRYDEESIRSSKAALWDIDHDDPEHPVYEDWFLKILNVESVEELKQQHLDNIVKFEEHRDQLLEELREVRNRKRKGH